MSLPTRPPSPFALYSSEDIALALPRSPSPSSQPHPIALHARRQTLRVERAPGHVQLELRMFGRMLPVPRPSSHISEKHPPPSFASLHPNLRLAQLHRTIYSLFLRFPPLRCHAGSRPRPTKV
eukprot:5346843-Pleurochrysis_carterae.AAC.1